MITRVKHNIKPNTMSTTFSAGLGSRNQIIWFASDLYMSLTDSLDLSKSNGKNQVVVQQLVVSHQLF
jgi:hypothetical protein